MPVYISISLGLIVLGVTAVVAYKVGRLVERKAIVETGGAEIKKLIEGM